MAVQNALEVKNQTMKVLKDGSVVFTRVKRSKGPDKETTSYMVVDTGIAKITEQTTVMQKPVASSSPFLSSPIPSSSFSSF